jgi:hypothetical protein
MGLQDIISTQKWPIFDGFWPNRSKPGWPWFGLPAQWGELHPSAGLPGGGPQTPFWGFGGSPDTYPRS